MSVKLIKSMLGGYQVSYSCPNCKEPLRSPIADIGKSDNCPACKQSYVVPTGPEVQAMAKKLAREKQEKEESEREKQAEKKRELEAAMLKKRIAEQQKSVPETAAYLTGVQPTGRPTKSVEAADSDLLSWAVAATRSWLQVVLILWWSGCLGGLLITGFAFHRVIPSLTSSGPEATAGDYAMVVMLAVLAVMGWLMVMAIGTVMVGLAGVLFEIERNTRR